MTTVVSFSCQIIIGPCDLARLIFDNFSFFKVDMEEAEAAEVVSDKGWRAVLEPVRRGTNIGSIVREVVPEDFG